MMDEEKDGMSFEAGQAISYITELERQNQRLQETSQVQHVMRLEEKIKDLERSYKNLLTENKNLKLRVAEFGLELGRKMNEEQKTNS